MPAGLIGKNSPFFRSLWASTSIKLSQLSAVVGHTSHKRKCCTSDRYS